MSQRHKQVKEHIFHSNILDVQKHRIVFVPALTWVLKKSAVSSRIVGKGFTGKLCCSLVMFELFDAIISLSVC